MSGLQALVGLERGLEEIDDLIQQKLAAKRAELQRELGLEQEEIRHFKRPEERPFTKDQRPHTTLLFGGLTWKHEHLIQGAFKGLGYRCEYLPTPDVQAFQLGKEFVRFGRLAELLQAQVKGVSRLPVVGSQLHGFP